MTTTNFLSFKMYQSFVSLYSSLLVLALTHLTLGSDQIPGAPQTKPILIQNAVLHTVSNGTLINHCILLKEGKIAQIEPVIAAQESYEVIDAQGKHVYPGLFDSLS
ncbi:MAG: hypothetical protein RLZZ396_1586, partial [Planctomycetota bacterium]